MYESVQTGCGPSIQCVKVKVKVRYPRYRPTWPRGVQEVKAPRFLDTRHTKVVRSSPLCTGRLYPQEYPGTHFLEAESTPGTWTCRMLRTFRLVAQRLKHYATPGPYTMRMGLFLSAVKRPGREADHSRPSNAEIKNSWSYTSTSSYDVMACLETTLRLLKSSA